MKSQMVISSNINNLFNPWDLVPAIKLDGGAMAKCASDSFQKKTEVTAKINFEPVAKAGSGGVHVGLVSSGSLFFKETCAGGDARFSVGVGEMFSVDAALDACGAGAGLQGSLLKVGMKKRANAAVNLTRKLH